MQNLCKFDRDWPAKLPAKKYMQFASKIVEIAGKNTRKRWKKYRQPQAKIVLEDITKFPPIFLSGEFERRTFRYFSSDKKQGAL